MKENPGGKKPNEDPFTDLLYRILKRLNPDDIERTIPRDQRVKVGISIASGLLLEICGKLKLNPIYSMKVLNGVERHFLDALGDLVEDYERDHNKNEGLVNEEVKKILDSVKGKGG